LIELIEHLIGDSPVFLIVSSAARDVAGTTSQQAASAARCKGFMLVDS
jgi:hypothetical protein